MHIQTKRLIITELTIADASFFFELVNDPDWKRFIGDRNVHSISDAKAYLTEKIIPSYENSGFGFYKVSLKTNNIPIGITGLVDREVLDHIDIGFAFLPVGRGKGYAFESSEAILSHAKNVLKLRPILAISNPDNERSHLLLKKLGLHFERMIILPNETREICLFST